MTHNFLQEMCISKNSLAFHVKIYGESFHVISEDYRGVNKTTHNSKKKGIDNIVIKKKGYSHLHTIENVCCLAICGWNYLTVMCTLNIIEQRQ